MFRGGKDTRRPQATTSVRTGVLDHIGSVSVAVSDGRARDERVGARSPVAGPSRRGERGAVTAEVAVVLPALVLLLALLLGTATIGVTQLRLE